MLNLTYITYFIYNFVTTTNLSQSKYLLRRDVDVACVVTNQWHCSDSNHIATEGQVSTAVQLNESKLCHVSNLWRLQEGHSSCRNVIIM